eukprot:8007430-Alexandrium_andersonii.AAC.1
MAAPSAYSMSGRHGMAVRAGGALFTGSSSDPSFRASSDPSFRASLMAQRQCCNTRITQL